MALVKCWDADGNERMKEPVDARECVAHCGFTLEAPETDDIINVEVVEKITEPIIEVIEKVAKKRGRNKK